MNRLSFINNHVLGPLFGKSRKVRSCPRSELAQRTRSRRLVVSSQAASDSKKDTGNLTKLWLPNNSHTYQLGQLLAKAARPGDVFFLKGELGAGKTSVARGFVHSARKDVSLDVTSPTFLLANTYPPSKDERNECPIIYHMDLWRLESASDRPIVNFDEVFSSAVSLIEWPDRLGELTPTSRLEVLLEYPPSGGEDMSSDDPWGFGDGDLTDSSTQGRYVSLIPYGSKWEKRVLAFYGAFTSLDSEKRTVFSHNLTPPPEQ